MIKECATCAYYVSIGCTQDKCCWVESRLSKAIRADERAQTIKLIENAQEEVDEQLKQQKNSYAYNSYEEGRLEGKSAMCSIIIDALKEGTE